jgi:hypothetical protein
VRGFDGHKRVKGRCPLGTRSVKGYLLVDTLGPAIASRVEPAGMSDRRGGTFAVVADHPHRHRRLSKDYECRVQTPEMPIQIAAVRLMLN